MSLNRYEKKALVADHFGGLISYLHAIRALAETVNDTKTKCAIDMLADMAMHSVTDAQDLVDELTEGARVK